MRLIDETTLLALDGSRPADTFLLWAWRGGKLALPEPLEVISWTARDTAGDSQKVGQQVTFLVADPDGTLGAWKYDDALSVAGTKLQAIYMVGGAGAINFGWFRITGNEPDEMVESRVIDEYGYKEPDGSLPEHKRRVYTTKSVVRLDAADLTLNADLDKLEAPESPGEGATVLSDFARLTKDHFPTVIDPGVIDRGLPGQLVYDRERLEACQDLLSRVSARYRMGGDGECHVYPYDTAPVLRIEPGTSLVSVKRKQSLTGLYNRWVVQGKEASNGQPVKGIADIDAGPLAYGGDHGKIPFFYQSEMIETAEQAVAYARELRAKFLASLAVELAVSIVPHPELQAGDRVEVGCPVPAGHIAYFPGTITDISRAGDNVPKDTTLTVSCSYTDILAALSSTAWSRYLTGDMPPLTWDRMPLSWGAVPSLTWTELP